MPISFQEILDALEFVSMDGGLGEHWAVLCRQTGKIYWRSEFSDLDELNDELPDDIDDDEKYVAIPNKRELGLGKPSVLDFAREFLPNDFNEIRYIFSKRGAYPKSSGSTHAAEPDFFFLGMTVPTWASTINCTPNKCKATARVRPHIPDYVSASQKATSDGHILDSTNL